LRERFDAGTGLVALGAILLLVSLFLDWFDPSGDAWAVFELVDIVLALAAIACLVAVVPRYAALGRAVPVIAFVTLFVVAVQIVDKPPGARGDDIAAGAWLALGGAALMAVGAALSAASISITVDVRGRDRRRRISAIDAREEREAREAREAATAPTTPAAPVPEPAPAPEPRRTRRRSAAPAGASAGGGPAPHAGDPPVAATDPDPDRTQALDPVDPPKEAP
jgi:hypothetical protein